MAKATPAAPRSMAAQERQWRAQDALGTLRRAAEIQGDKRLMRDVQSEARKQVQALSKVAGKPAPNRKR